jgi:uncharacterized protein YceH (UPF0502 family)
MAELLLRGEQTEGELRARAARMDPIPDLAALRSILNALESKRLVVWLTPAGRGRVLSRTLYTAREMEDLRVQFAAGSAAATVTAEDTEPAVQPPVGTAATRPPARGEDDSPGGGELKQDVEELRSQVAQLRADLDEVTAALRRAEDDLQRLRSELGA